MRKKVLSIRVDSSIITWLKREADRNISTMSRIAADHLAKAKMNAGSRRGEK